MQPSPIAAESPPSSTSGPPGPRPPYDFAEALRRGAPSGLLGTLPSPHHNPAPHFLSHLHQQAGRSPSELLFEQHQELLQRNLFHQHQQPEQIKEHGHLGHPQMPLELAMVNRVKSPPVSPSGSDLGDIKSKDEGKPEVSSHAQNSLNIQNKLELLMTVFLKKP